MLGTKLGNMLGTKLAVPYDIASPIAVVLNVW